MIRTIRSVSLLWALGLSLLACGVGTAAATAAQHQGPLYLVGMGPGNPELITLQAKRILKQADRVYCFGYLRQEVARFAPRDRIVVASPLLMGGHRKKEPAQLQGPERQKALQRARQLDSFDAQVRALVASGKTVALATAGDPTLFSPWSWAMERFADLKPMIIPGLSSFNAANAALQGRVTGANGAVLLSAGENLGTLDQRGRLNLTLVLFTHRRRIEQLVPRLLARYPADTPIAIVCEASYDSQQVLRATLGTVQAVLAGRTLPHLYLLYVGDGLPPGQNRARAVPVPGSAGPRQ